MFSLSTIIAMNARADRKRKKDRERAAAKRAAKRASRHSAQEKSDAINRYFQDNDQ